MAGEVSRVLDEEHNSTLDLLAALEQALRHSAGALDVNAARLVERLREHLLQHVPRHFGFEEEALFPRLAEAGDGDLCELLQEEHVAINAVIAEVLPLTESVSSLDQASLSALRRGIVELTERLRSHIDKETMALLPSCDDCLDETVDQELAFEYASA
jgi:hemerythrin-like domain-containing protein